MSIASIKSKGSLFAAGLFMLVIGMNAVSATHASALTATAAPKVSFTFDDGLNSAITQAAPTLAKYGYTGTDYVITDCVGMTTAPNTCHANTDATYMNWDQITQLNATYGWEIGSHTASHPYLASSDASDGQPNVLTPQQVTDELVNSKAALAAHGIDATDMATPYGDYNWNTLPEIAKYYNSMRGFADTGYNPFPYQDYILRDQQVQAGVTVAQVKAYIDSAIANNQWLILTFHDIKTNASSDPDDYEYKTADLDAIAAYVKSKNVSVVNIKDGLAGRATADNLLPTSSFDTALGTAGDTTKWTTDNAATVKIDAQNNGSVNTPQNSVSLTSGATDSHLFSPTIAINPADTYFIKSYLNMKAIGSGGRIGYYIDEYDANGNWISGQNRVAEVSIWVENINFEYKPTSANVARARLQVINTASTGAQAYVDNFMWFSETGLTTPTPPIGTTTPPVDTPPVDVPPVDTPPVDNPPVDVPPVVTPPVETPTPPTPDTPATTTPATTPTPVPTPPTAPVSHTSVGYTPSSDTTTPAPTVPAPTKKAQKHQTRHQSHKQKQTIKARNASETNTSLYVLLAIMTGSIIGVVSPLARRKYQANGLDQE